MSLPLHKMLKIKEMLETRWWHEMKCTPDGRKIVIDGMYANTRHEIDDLYDDMIALKNKYEKQQEEVAMSAMSVDDLKVSILMSHNPKLEPLAVQKRSFPGFAFPLLVGAVLGFLAALYMLDKVWLY